MALTRSDAIAAFNIGVYTVVTADDTNGYATIDITNNKKSRNDFDFAKIQVTRAGVIQDITGVTIAVSGAVLTVTEGGTYALTAADKITYTLIKTRSE
jgi:hypothetical protein